MSKARADALNKILSIVGPTATGKTKVALKLAKIYNGELIACDSRQVYKGLDIGTGKDNAKAWMYDIADPDTQYTVYDYINDATKIVDDIQARGKLPIVVGGTGLYLKGLLEGIPTLSYALDEQLRKELENLSVEQLQKKIQLLSPIRFEKMNSSDQKNPRRLIRAIEVLMNPNMNRIMNDELSEARADALRTMDWDVLKIGLTAPREVLNSRIDQRLDSRIKEGLIDEGRRLLKDGVSLKRMRSLGLEYGVMADLLEGLISEQEFEEKLKVKIHQYAKRQLTWFKKDPLINWFDITGKSYVSDLEKLVSEWYD